MTDAVETLFDNFGANPFTGSRVNNTPQEIAAFDPTGNPQPQGWIGAGAVDNIASFAASIRPVFLVTALPALPDANYPVGQFVYKTNDVPPRLYKNVADAWVAAVGPNDIQADSITAGQIAAGAISASELAANAVIASKIAVGAVLDEKLAAGSAGGNLIANPGFENNGSAYVLGDPIADAAEMAAALPGWTDVTVPTGGNVHVANSVNASGARRLGITTGNPATTGRAWSNYFPVRPGTTLKGSVRVRGTGANVGTANAALWIRWYKANQTASATIETQVGANLNVGTDITWANKIEGSVTVPSDAFYARATCVLSATSSPSVFIAYDDVSVTAAADITNETGTVQIDSSGITISNGKLVLQDEFGLTTMEASGFAGSWSDYVSSGLYNARFLAGIVGTVPNGRTSSLPYWTVSDLNVGSTLAFLAGGAGIKFTFGAALDSKQLVSDPIPMVAGANYEFGMRHSWVCTTGGPGDTIQPRIYYQYSDDPTFTFFSTSLVASAIFGGANGTSGNGDLRGVDSLTAKYARLVIEVTQLAYTAGDYVIITDAWLRPIPYALGPTTYLGDGQAPAITVDEWLDPGIVIGGDTYTYNTVIKFGGSLGLLGGAVRFGSSVGLDTQINRTAVEELTISDASGGELSSGLIVKGPIETTKHVKFPATQVPSSDVNALDDYEEGTFTPVLTYATPGTSSWAYTIQSGSYTKIGNRVFLSVRVAAVPTNGTAAGVLSMGGLPFTVQNEGNNNVDVLTCVMSGWTKANYTWITGVAGDNNASFTFMAGGSGQAQSQLVVGDIPTGGSVNIRMTGVVQVAT